ncbi:MAG: M28 family peptidase [Sandaracinaceae bacterium]|nr:M28 family peptidase [Sandaracinaceae bacterium]
MPVRKLALIALGLGVLCAVAAWRATSMRMPGEAFEGPPPAPSREERALASALERDVRALAVDIGERNDRRYPALVRARDHLEARLREVGLAPERDGYEVNGLRVDTLFADAGGGRLLLGAHYDSAIGSPGANDNASGVAVVLALAEPLAAAPPAGGVRIALFPNEEPPHFARPSMGSRVYAARAADRGELPEGAIILDSVGYYADAPGSQRFGVFWHSIVFGDRGDFVAFVSDARSEPLLRRSIEAFRREARVRSEGAVLSPRSRGASWSDHASFWAHGVPALLVTDTAAFRDPSYHQPTDDGHQIDYVALARVTVALEAAIRAVEAE